MNTRPVNCVRRHKGRFGSSAALSLALALLCSATGASAQATDFYGGGTGGNTLIWDHPSHAAVVETISSLGGGRYRYSFTLTNNDIAGIWDVAVYTPFTTSDFTPFVKTPVSWKAVHDPLSETIAPYDARNVDPLLTTLTGNYAPDFGQQGMPPQSPIAVGETATGFSFTADVYDPAPKLYCYDWQGHYDPGFHGHVTAAGYTLVPEPSSLLTLLCGLGGVGGMVRRRKR